MGEGGFAAYTGDMIHTLANCLRAGDEALLAHIWSFFYEFLLAAFRLVTLVATATMQAGWTSRPRYRKPLSARGMQLAGAVFSPLVVD